jgi:hypothetical protein
MRRNNLKEYYAWRDMMRRCCDPSNKDFRYYGGRGITVCERWQKSFDNFMEDMGSAPRGLTLDRINNELNYSKDNCRWTTMKEQSLNRRATIFITYQGISMCANDWGKNLGVTGSCIRYRLSVGWPLNKALTTNNTRSKAIATQGGEGGKGEV